MRIFLGNTDNFIAFPKTTDFTISNLRSFLRDNVDIYIGLPGCLKNFDKLAVGFAKGDNKKEKLKEAEELKQTLKSEVCAFCIISIFYYYNIIFRWKRPQLTHT